MTITPDPALVTTQPSSPGDVSDEDWRTQALCLDDPRPNRWIDLPQIRVRGRNNPAYDQHLLDLKAVCSACQARPDCLTYALTHDTRGVFAGTDEYERADIRDHLNLPHPDPLPPPENEEDARLLTQQFEALRLARQNRSNTEIATILDISPMTVSRIMASDDKAAPRRARQDHPEHPTDT